MNHFDIIEMRYNPRDGGLSMGSGFIGYVRVSTDEQARIGVSLEAQEAKIRDYARLNDLDLSRIIRDEGESGKNLRRPGVLDIISMVKHKEIEGIIVYKLDRLSRKVIDTLNLIEQFDKSGIAFHSITEKIDTKTAAGRFFLTILSALAQMERDLISERTKGALNYKRSKGGCAGNVPYGYRKVGEKKYSMLVIDKDEMPILSEIKKMRQGGVSYNGIATHLNFKDIKTRDGGIWYAETIKSILQHSLS
jgi:DNA invertase Pin-like site-specific DNA recombinase